MRRGISRVYSNRGAVRSVTVAGWQFKLATLKRSHPRYAARDLPEVLHEVADLDVGHTTLVATTLANERQLRQRLAR